MKRPAIEDIKTAIVYNSIAGTFHWTQDQSVYYTVRGKETGTSGPKGHRTIVFKGQPLKAHHIAWAIYYDEWPIEIDHKDNNRSNNKINNLRKATRQTNQMNRIISKNNSSGYKGVTKRKYGDFEAKIIVEKRYIHIGKYKTPEEAAKAYDLAAIKHHGDFAKTNKMLGLLT